VATRIDSPPPSPLERLLDRDRWLIAISLGALVALAWGYLIAVAAQMARGDMRWMGLSDLSSMRDMVMPPEPWTATTFVLMSLMWWVMMIGMMLPSAAPMVLLFGGVQRRQLPEERPALRVALFTAGYLAIWAAFSALAAGAQWALTRAGLLSSMGLTTTRSLGALVLALAGIYQLTPLKNRCLRQCRSPAEFLSSRWRAGSAGAWRMGVVHGAFCVGCCWLLMGILFVVGVMNLLWVAALGGFVLLEKLVPRGEWLARASGVLLLAFAAYLLATTTMPGG
jgi:predicted metal-binding membrane protein